MSSAVKTILELLDALPEAELNSLIQSFSQSPLGQSSKTMITLLLSELNQEEELARIENDEGEKLSLFKTVQEDWVRRGQKRLRVKKSKENAKEEDDDLKKLKTNDDKVGSDKEQIDPESQQVQQVGGTGRKGIILESEEEEGLDQDYQKILSVIEEAKDKTLQYAPSLRRAAVDLFRAEDNIGPSGKGKLSSNTRTHKCKNS